MFYLGKTAVVLLLSLVIGCNNSDSISQRNSNQSPSKELSSSPTPAETASTISSTEDEKGLLKDTLIIPGERVGPVTQKTTREDLVKIFGESRLSDETISGPEGMGKIPITKVNLGKERSFIINWDNNRRKIVYISNLGSDWKTPEGINIGTSFEKLQEILGEFKLTGLAWDYGGYVNLENTKLSKYRGKLSIRVDAAEDANNKFPKQFLEVTGDQELSSTNPNWKNLDVRVSQITVQFDEGNK